MKILTWVRFELTPFQTGALSQRLRPLGHHAKSEQCDIFFFYTSEIRDNPLNNKN